MKIAEGVDVMPARLALQLHPELWNQNTIRRDAPESPHTAMADIWIRYNDDTECRKTGDYSRFNDPHDPIWYPAYYALPQLRPLIFGLMARVEATRLGGVLITRIPPGGHIQPHIDRGWHVEHYNTKLYVVLQGNEHCINRVEDETIAMQTGDVWYFDNTKEHEVINNGTDDRITLILCFRTE